MSRLIFPLFFFLFSLPSYGISLSSTGWSYPESSFGALSEAGTYHSSSITSNTSSASLSISNAPTSPDAENTECGAIDPAWRVSARLSSNVSGLAISVRRIDDGSGGSVSSGESYITLNTSSQTFFCGNDDVSSINLQIKIDGIDISDGHGEKSWDIRYTVETL